ncbi:LacI family DNA-binding transcriptional regulator [Sinorhizobium meliloti]|uniref:LacI family DNA-binding transcriptional regulator n=1 Tax=Rhizobium meliloti TaxID=382 RepID=UPI000FDA2356|nr:LacI family DNA-binding transcriptional regulator [Sinorhizobium meliloti]RVG34653.1 LacI family DNA-binding transcriptional regulator [Sinorhizobium meliloti]
MKRKLIDVARRAGVGHATVDRVLNERGGVRPETAKRVLDAARDLGFDRKLPTLYRQGLRFEVLLGRRQMPLCARLSDAIVRFGRPFEDIVAIERTFVDETRPELVAEAIHKSRGNALVVYGQDHELIIDAIAEVTSAGKPVVTIVSDVPSAPRLSYVGIDHYKAGRCAAFFLAKMAGEGSIVLLCSSLYYRAEAERISGCRDGMADHADRQSVSALVELDENDPFAGEELSKALEAGKVTGIYNAGVSHAVLGRALAAHSLGPPPVLVGHDISPDAERMLQQGVMTLVIDQNPDLQVRKALRILASRFGLPGVVAESPVVPFTVLVRDSL